MNRLHPHPAPAARARGFTLVELMVVLSIIIVIVAAAVPAVRSITGTRSNEVAINKISAFLGRARLRAIGLQEKTGVFFYIDSQTKLVSMAMVHVTPARSVLPNDAPGFTFLDFVPDQGTETLPRGVGVQFLNNPIGTTDRYIGYNTANAAGASTGPVAFGGVMLFDGSGRLAVTPYAFRCFAPNLAIASATATEMGLFLSQSTDFIPGSTGSNAVYTQFGFALYDPEAFSNQGYFLDDPSINPAPPAPNTNSNETAEETWIDTNGLPLLVNRYNGTLIKGE